MARTEDYVVNADQVAAGKVVMDGVREPRRWSTLTVGCGTHQADGTLGTGTVVFQVERIHAAGRVIRRFALQAYESVCLDFAPYDNARVVVLGATSNTHRVYAVFSELPMASRVQTAFYPAAVEAGTHVTPWGAIRLTSSTADPGFAWVGHTAAGATVTIPAAIAAYETKEVRAPLYTTSLAFSAVWEVEL